MTFGKREIGSTGLMVTELGLGTAAMAGNHRPVTTEDAAAAIETALEAGVSFADTAPFYGFGRSERQTGDALRGRSDWVLSTKAGRLLAPGPGSEEERADWPVALPFHPVYDYSYPAVMRSFEDSLQRLGLDRIDILLLHDIGEMTHGAEGNAEHMPEAMSGGYLALEELRRSGDIRAIGLGVNEKAVCLKALEHGDWDVFLLAGRYTLLEQDPIHDLMPEMEKRGMSMILGGPFNSGILAGGETWNYAKAPAEVIDRARRIAEVCAAHRVPLPAAALRFPLGHKLVSSVIPGPRSAAEMGEILGWWEMDIPGQLWSDLKGQGLIDAAAPVPG